MRSPVSTRNKTICGDSWRISVLLFTGKDGHAINKLLACNSFVKGLLSKRRKKKARDTRGKKKKKKNGSWIDSIEELHTHTHIETNHHHPVRTRSITPSTTPQQNFPL